MKIAKTYGYLKKDLNYIEQALNNAIQAEHPVLRDAASQLLNAGGKRIRPVFVLLAGQFGNYHMERLKTVAVSLELIHMATLVHDDVIDDAELRRGKPTIRQLYDNRVAMYAGDYILARSLEEITLLEKPKAHHVLSETIVEVCIGEIEQIKDKYDLNQHLRNYLRRIKRKTALLIATSCELGAIAADASEKLARKLYKYGYYIGMSYQIIDDILDFTSSAQELGKPVGNDMLQGNLTLPALIAMQDDDFKDLLQEAYQHPHNISDEQMEHLLSTLHDTNAIANAYELSNRYLAKALAIVDQLPDGKAKQSLKEVAKYIGKRKT